MDDRYIVELWIDGHWHSLYESDLYSECLQRAIRIAEIEKRSTRVIRLDWLCDVPVHGDKNV